MIQYKIIRIAGLHYTSLMGNLNKSLVESSYYEIREKVFNNFYVYSDSFSNAMNSIGHICDEIIYDFRLLQTKWAEENGIKFSKNTWIRDILFAQIRKIKPDILYFQDVHSLSLADFCSLKAYFPFLKKVVIFRGYPGLDETSLKKLITADVIFVGSPLLKEKLKQFDIPSFLVYHFFDNRILNKVKCSNQMHQVTFIGTSGYGYGSAHLPRYVLLDELLKKTEIKLWVDEVGHKKRSKIKEEFRNFLKRLFFKNKKTLDFLANVQLPKQITHLVEEVKNEKEFLENLYISYPLKPLSKKYKNRCFDPVFGLGMYKVMANSKITLNKHSLAAENYSDNIRMFQATGMGSCLVTERSENLHQLFEEDVEVVTYSSMDECIEKINYLSANESARQAIALKGQQRTLKYHTALQRAQQINEVIQLKK